MPASTIVHALERNAAERGHAAACYEKTTGSWRSTTWHDLNQLTRRAAGALLGLGVDVGDVVTILGANRPEWTVAALAAMRVGGIASGIYTTSAPSEIAYIVNHAASKVIVVESDALLEQVRSQRTSMPTLEHIVLMRGADEADMPGVHRWEDFLARGDGAPDHELDDRLAALRPDQVAEFIYTSGTTGPPKAVMLTHANLVWTAEALRAAAGLHSDDVTLSYLPLSHIAEQMATIHLSVTVGYAVHYCHDPLKLADYLTDVRPTVLFGIPRVWERFRTVIEARLNHATGLKAAIVAWARDVGARVTDLRNQGIEPHGRLAIERRLADRLVFSKVRAAAGLDRAHTFICGAAPTPTTVLEFFGSLGICLLEFYGLSETSGAGTANIPGATRFGTVGRPTNGVDVTLTADGEILVRGPNVFAAYHNDAAATAETLVDGWLHTGDLGRFDADGYLSIIGRRKDIIITSGGKNIAPRNLEEALGGLELVAQAVCVGEQERFLVALITLDPDAAERFAVDHNLERTSLHDHPALRRRLEVDIAEHVNANVARVEHIRNFVVLPTQFSVDTGELTPTLKIRRAFVNELYADDIAQAYAAGQKL